VTISTGRNQIGTNQTAGLFYSETAELLRRSCSGGFNDNRRRR